MELLTHFHIEEIVEYRIHFSTSPGGGYSFDCDEKGNVDVEKLRPEGRANYESLISGAIPTIERPLIQEFCSRVKHYATGKCDECGAIVELSSGEGNDCECGAIYNMSGQRLRPRSQWGYDGTAWDDEGNPNPYERADDDY
jgi:hypothetical protein